MGTLRKFSKAGTFGEKKEWQINPDEIHRFLQEIDKDNDDMEFVDSETVDDILFYLHKLGYLELNEDKGE